MAKLLIDNNVAIEVNEGSESTIRVAGGEVTVQIKEQKRTITLEKHARFMEWYAESIQRSFDLKYADLKDFDLKETWFQRVLGRFGF